MVARARKHNESFKKYRINLKKEAAAEKARGRKPGFISVEFFNKAIDGVVQRMKRTKTHSDGMRTIKQSRQAVRNHRRSEMKAARARG